MKCTITPVVLFVVFCTAPFSKADTLVDLQSDKDEILKFHNDYREYHGSPGLTWSNALSSGARAWARKCTWEHSPSSSRENKGENLYASLGYSSGSAYSLAASSWYDEVALYDYNDPGKPVFKDVGHFTQMVWKGSTELGCAREMCPGGSNSPFSSDVDWVFVVCRYSPAGNILSAGNDEYAFFRTNVLKPGAAVVPVVAPVSCSGNLKTIKMQISGKGSSCEAGRTAIKAAKMLGELVICKWGYQCKQKGSKITIRGKIKVPASQMVLYINSIASAIKNGKFYDLWSEAQGEIIQASQAKFKVCQHGKKGC